MTLDQARERMREALARAKKAHRLNENGKRRLKKFSLLTRLLAYTKFSSLRKTIKRHETDRFSFTSVSLFLARQIKFAERRAKARKK